MRTARAIDRAVELEVAGGTVELWLAEPGRAPWPSVEQARTLLTQDERERCEQVIVPSGRERMLGERAAVRVILGARLDLDPRVVPLERDGRGRPLLDPAALATAGCSTDARAGALSLSISHCRGWLAVALGRGVSVGVDIELRHRVVAAKVIARFLTGRELESLRSLSEEARGEAFLRHWTLKEACAKALGTGLGASLERLELADALDRPRLLDPGLAHVQVRSWNPGPELIGAVAAAGPAAAPVSP